MPENTVAAVDSDDDDGRGIVKTVDRWTGLAKNLAWWSVPLFWIFWLAAAGAYLMWIKPTMEQIAVDVTKPLATIDYVDSMIAQNEGELREFIEGENRALRNQFPYAEIKAKLAAHEKYVDILKRMQSQLRRIVILIRDDKEMQATRYHVEDLIKEIEIELKDSADVSDRLIAQLGGK